jgi:hypothetical protein
MASIPGDTPCTAGGVCGVGVGTGVALGLGLGVGVGVAVGEGVGTGEGETGMRLAPVAKLKLDAVWFSAAGKRR